ncbi:MAG: ATP-binding protein [Sphingobacteriia bacterium]|nr:ATP-binding protein [Sphingobacteriia bacterium]
MVFNGFQKRIFLRIIAISGTAICASWITMMPSMLFPAITLWIILLILVFELFRYTEQSNRKLTRFLEYVKHGDFSPTFSDDNLSDSFSNLNASFNAIIKELKSNRTSKEEHLSYLQTVVSHISIGVLVFKEDGKVDMFNHAASELLGISDLRYINDLSTVSEKLKTSVLSLKSGQRQLIKISVDGQLKQLNIHSTQFKLRNELFTLLSLQDIRSELEEKEIESWQRLIRVLTHEIMNSITPISSLAGTLNDMMFSEDGTPIPLDNEDRASIQQAIETIANRSKGLLSFMELYRDLTRIPKPNFKYFAVAEAFKRLDRLMGNQFEELEIKTNYLLSPDDLMITADPDLLDQVLINLALNAKEALRNTNDKSILFKALTNKSGKVIIEVTDNGQGISPDLIDKIFMPFFTSKKEGSGIGLSLSRQIMHLHKGTITVNSKPDQGATFTLTF